MAIDIATLRTRFPEFTDDTVYPDARIDIFIEDSQLIYMGTVYGQRFLMTRNVCFVGVVVGNQL